MYIDFGDLSSGAASSRGSKSTTSRSSASSGKKKPLIEETFKNEADKHARWSYLSPKIRVNYSTYRNIFTLTLYVTTQALRFGRRLGSSPSLPWTSRIIRSSRTTWRTTRPSFTNLRRSRLACLASLLLQGF